MATHDCVVGSHCAFDGHEQLFDDAGQHMPFFTVSPAAQHVPPIPTRPLVQHTPFEQLSALAQPQLTVVPQPALTCPHVV
jgi:hypothetical protein